MKEGPAVFAGPSSFQRRTDCADGNASGADPLSLSRYSILGTPFGVRFFKNGIELTLGKLLTAKACHARVLDLHHPELEAV